MQTKNLYLFLLFASFPLSASQPHTPNPREFKLTAMLQSDPAPSKIELSFKLPDIEKLAHATERASQAIERFPYAAGKAALITIGGLCAAACVYQGVKRLCADKKDKISFGLISGGIVSFVALCYLATTQWFTYPQ